MQRCTISVEKNVFLHLMTFDHYFDPLNGKISLGNTPSRIQHLEIIQKKYVICFSPKMPHTFTFPKICTSLLLNPAPLTRCPHGWLRRYKTFWFLSSVICAMRPSIVLIFQPVISKPSYFLGWRKVLWTLIIWRLIDQSQIFHSSQK